MMRVSCLTSMLPGPSMADPDLAGPVVQQSLPALAPRVVDLDDSVSVALYAKCNASWTNWEFTRSGQTPSKRQGAFVSACTNMRVLAPPQLHPANALL